ncbi:MAG: PHP domain-containing protein [Planctomycetota bacterium]
MLRGRDYHIHTGHIGCGGNTATVAQIFRRCEELGFTSIAITDHLNRLDQLDKHKAIRADIEANSTSMEVFFGAELDIPPHMAPLPYNKIIKENIGFRFAIGGVHGTYLDRYDLQKLIDLQHQALCKTAAEPLIDVVVHPWWFSKHEFDKKGFPWFDDLSVVPQDLHLEFIRAAVANEKAIEINAGAIYCNPAYSDRFKTQYNDYVRLMVSEGARLSICSDAHSLDHLERTCVVEDILENLGVPDDCLWHPTQGRSMKILEH